jgi:PKD repeat protein
MSPDHSPRHFGALVRLAVFAAIVGSLTFSVQPAAAQPPGMSYARGQAAINHLGARLPAVAAQHNMAAARLIQLFQSDPYLAVDEADNLLFIDEFLPEEGGTVPGGGTPAGAEAIDPAQTFFLHSLPGARKVIYLDFDGHTTTGTPWNNSYGATIVSAPYDSDGLAGFSTAELTNIQYIWQRVAEDFLPYGVDVTTQDPGAEQLRNTGGGDEYWGQRVVISPTNWYSVNAGGVAYIGAFSWSSDTPCFVFTAQLGSGNEKYTAEAATHEAGHTVGLYHDGANPNTGYYSGHSGWAPIMGVGYYQNLVQWSKGEYPNANNTEDDLTIMTGYGFTFRPDDHGNWAADATPLTITNKTSVSGGGIIEQPDDKDAFSFMTGAGTITLSVNGAARSPNLDIRAELHDSAGNLVVAADPSTSLSASISVPNASAGTYTLVIDGVGNGDLATGYSDYGSLGEYTITGTIVDPGVAQPPVAVATAAPTSGYAPLPVQFSGSGSSDPDGTIANYAWDFGDGSGASGLSGIHTYSAGNSYTAVLTVTDNAGWTDSASVVITVIGPPAAPSGLSATAMSSSQINLKWTDGSSTETGFVVQRSTGGAGWADFAPVGANVTTYSNTGLSPNTAYSYRLRASNPAGDSAYTNETSATTFAPATIHVGDLDGSRSVSKKNWSAKVTITVHDATEKVVSGAVVSGNWSTGPSGSCTTGSRGTCTITASGVSLGITSVRFTLSGVIKAGATYDASKNHDPDGGMTSQSYITITK